MKHVATNWSPLNHRWSLALALLAVPSAAQGEARASIDWVGDLSAARAQALAADKPLLVALRCEP